MLGCSTKGICEEPETANSAPQKWLLFKLPRVAAFECPLTAVIAAMLFFAVAPALIALVIYVTAVLGIVVSVYVLWQLSTIWVDALIRYESLLERATDCGSLDNAARANAEVWDAFYDMLIFLGVTVALLATVSFVRPRISNLMRGPQSGPAPADAAPKLPLTRAQRLRVFFDWLRAQPRSRTADEALTRINQTLDEVENAHSGVPAKDPPPPPNMPDGRMYPPLPDNIMRNPDGSIFARTRGHDIFIDRDGSIRMINRQTGEVDFQQPGSE